MCVSDNKIVIYKISDIAVANQSFAFTLYDTICMQQTIWMRNDVIRPHDCQLCIHIIATVVVQSQNCFSEASNKNQDPTYHISLQKLFMRDCKLYLLYSVYQCVPMTVPSHFTVGISNRTNALPLPLSLSRSSLRCSSVPIVQLYIYSISQRCVCQLKSTTILGLCELCDLENLSRALRIVTP